MSGCKYSGWHRAPVWHLAGLAWVLAIFGGCKDTSNETEDKAPVAVIAAEAKAPPATPLDPRWVPTEALAALQGIELNAEAPCSLTIDTLRPALESIADYQKKLASATSEETAIQLLAQLSDDLRARLPTIAARTENDERRRISAELSAALGDLAESLQLASEAIRNHDKSAATTTMRRIYNGIANTRSSVEGLIEQCALQ